MTTSPTHTYPPTSLRWLITITVMLVTIMEILDMTIVNVALPTMTGELSANADQITWVLTSYIVSAAIIMPMTGYFVARLGRKRYMLIMIVGFLISSMLCGLSQSLSQIVFFRVLQGVFGASLVPMSQYILADTFPPEQAGLAMAMWGIGVMVAPIMGPTLGGYITHHLDWRWVFYINAPVCAITFLMTLQFIEETPREKAHTDWLGMALMAAGIGCLQIFLDRGNTNNWLASRSMQIILFICVAASSGFFIRGIGKKNNIINLSIYRNRNFSIASLLLAIFAMGIFSLISIQPLMLEQLMGYSSENAGLVMMPRGIASLLGMLIVAKTINRIDGRWIITAGVAFSAYGTWLMSHLSTQAGFSTIAWEGTLQGFGMGMFFVPVAGFSLSTLPAKQRAEASGLFGFGRNLGSSIGISLISTIISRETQINWNRLGAHLTDTSIATQHWLKVQSEHMTHQQVFAQLGQELHTQASSVAFINAFYAVLISFLIMLPLIWILKRVKLGSTPGH